jgi:hypothetical protein
MEEDTNFKLEVIKTHETEDYQAMYSILLENGYPLVVDLPIDETMKYIKGYLEEKGRD